MHAAGDKPAIACACKWHLCLKDPCMEETWAHSIALSFCTSRPLHTHCESIVRHKITTA